MTAVPYNQRDLRPLREKDNTQYIPEEDCNFWIILEIKQYAAYIGVNLPDEDYMWELAKQGVMASLPSGWEACQTPDGELVYRNIKTRQVQQQHPMDQVYKQRVLDLREAYKRYEQQGSENEQLNTIPEEKSSERSYHDNSELDELMIPSKQLFSPSNTLKQQQNSALNQAMINENSKDLHLGLSQQNSKLLLNLSVDKTNNLISYHSQQRSISSQREKLQHSEQSIEQQKQKLKKQLEMLLNEQKLAEQLLLELQKDNKRRTERMKKRMKKIKERNA